MKRSKYRRHTFILRACYSRMSNQFNIEMKGNVKIALSENMSSLLKNADLLERHIGNVLPFPSFAIFLFSSCFTSSPNPIFKS